MMTGREILLSHPSPSKMMLRIIMLSGCIAVCSLAIAVLHIPLSNKPALMLFSAIPVFMVVSAELFGQIKAKRRSLTAQPAIDQPNAAVLTELGQVRASVEQIATAQQNVTTEVLLGQQRLADQIVAVASNQSEQSAKNQELFARLFEQLAALRTDVIMLEQANAPEEIAVPAEVADSLLAVKSELDRVTAVVQELEKHARESISVQYNIPFQSPSQRPLMLTPRERQVYASMRTGKTDSEIAEFLGLPRYMVSAMMANLRRKLAGRGIETPIEPERAEER